MRYMARGWQEKKFITEDEYFYLIKKEHLSAFHDRQDHPASG